MLNSDPDSHVFPGCAEQTQNWFWNSRKIKSPQESNPGKLLCNAVLYHILGIPMYVMYPQLMHVYDKEVKSPVLSIIEIVHDGKNNSERMVYSISGEDEYTEWGKRQGRGNIHRVIISSRKGLKPSKDNDKGGVNNRKQSNINPEAAAYFPAIDTHNN